MIIYQHCASRNHHLPVGVNCEHPHLVNNEIAFAAELCVATHFVPEWLAKIATRFVMRRQLDLVDANASVAELN